VGDDVELKKSKRVIKKLVWHTSDSPDRLQDIGAADIKRWHTDPPPKGNGWSDIGYHFCVKRNGAIELGRDVDLIGSHVKGHNADSIGLVWVGRDRPTYDQRQTMWELTLELLELYDLRVEDVYGHKELAAGKACPVINMDTFREELKLHEPKWREER
jgi:N-acetylmuramoyl-L-alanine amidase